MKIKIIHLLIDENQNDEIDSKKWNEFRHKQNQSTDYFGNLSQYFYKYTKVYNKRFVGPPPIETCNTPECYVSDPSLKPQSGAWVSSGHYGAFQAHRESILTEFNDDLDAILIVEGDVVCIPEPKDFSEIIKRAYEFAKSNSASFITFANTPFGEGSDAINNIVSHGDYDKIDHFLCCNCYMILKEEKNQIQDKLKDAKWMAFDVWLYWNYDKRVPIFRTHTPVAYENPGFSLIDFETKESNYLP